jgi:aerobic carbon-monoxide dehydrogenase medium subunit
VTEALDELAPADGGVRPVGGGTALMLLMKYGFLRPARLVGLKRLTSELGGIGKLESGELRVGALTTLRDLELSPEVAGRAPVLVAPLQVLANVRVRNVATLGGHLAHADPHQDLPPVLLTLGASARAVSRRGSRSLGLDELITGYYETDLQPDELLTEIIIPAQPPGSRGSYTKFTAVAAEDWPALGVAVLLQEEGGRLRDVRLALSAATDRPLRLAAVERILEGERPTASLFEAAADTAASVVEPLPDGGASPAYKREMVRVHVRRALEKTMRAQPQEVS